MLRYSFRWTQSYSAWTDAQFDRVEAELATCRWTEAQQLIARIQSL